MSNRRSHRKDSLGIELAPKWVAWAIVLALLLHMALFALLRSTELQKFGEAYYEKIVPRSFKLKRVEIDPALLDDPADRQDVPEVPLPPETITLPEEKPLAETPARDIRITPEAEQPLDIAAALAQDKPSVDSTIEQALAGARPAGGASSTADLPEIDLSDIAIGEQKAGRPTMDLPPGTASPSRQTGSPDFTNLDALLASTGPVADGKPILMDAGLLFDYDSATLRPAATGDLAKVAALIARSPDASIIVEGHTDSFGSDDYNFELSRQRALSVKQWLVDNAGIPSDRIATTGFGKQRLIAPASGSIDEQQINRRVEITIRRPAAPMP